MFALQVRQTISDGRSRVWRIEGKRACHTFGSSRKAHLVSIDKNSPAFAGFFECRADGWHFINFDLKMERPDLHVAGKIRIELEQGHLDLEPLFRDDFLLPQIENVRGAGALSRRLYLVQRNRRLLAFRILPAGEKFRFTINGIERSFELHSSNDWSEEVTDGFVVRSRLIQTEDLKLLEKARGNLSLNEEGTRPALISFSAVLLLIGLSFFAGKKEDSVPLVQAPAKALNIAVRMEKKNKPTQRRTTAAPESAAGGSGGRTASLGARISQLLGKVSATEARTRNIFVSARGVKANEGASGRALASLGKVESSGRNWGAEAAGSGTGVATAGIGGGRGTQGLGAGLGQGKTGSGGVGLIEEESEITGGLDREVIAQYIKTQLGQILFCYERQLSALPDLYGKIAVKFTISPSGRVETQAINDTTLKNKAVEGCVLNKVAQWVFPEPKGGTRVLVTYPFLFKSTN